MLVVLSRIQTVIALRSALEAMQAPYVPLREYVRAAEWLVANGYTIVRVEK